MKHEIIPFRFESWDLRALEINGEPWVIAKDVCAVLGLKNVGQATSSLKDDEKSSIAPNVITGDAGFERMMKAGGLNVRSVIPEAGRGGRPLTIVNEPGLFRLIFLSRMPEAERLKKFVFHEILPKIRRTGSYAPEPAQPAETLSVKAAAALNDLAGRATLYTNHLERENRWLREKDRMRWEVENLRAQLAQKNTPLSKNEEAQIAALSKSASASQIARMMNRSASAIRRALKRAKGAT